MKTTINKIFLSEFVKFNEEEFDACEGFIERMKRCKTNAEITYVLCRYGENIIDALGIDVDDTEKVMDLEDQIADLETDLDEYREKEFQELPSMIDQMKLECFMRNMNNFSLEQIENMMNRNIEAA